LPDRKILVTGAAAGIGRACAEAALREGAAVALADQDRRRLEETASALTTLGALSAVEMDVAAQGAVAAGVGRAAEALGGLDGVVNCAGIDLHQPFEATDWAAWRRLMAVNLDGAMHVCQAALEPLKASGGGAIVNIASGAGLKPIPDRVAYCASKAGLIMATKALAMDLAKHRIRVNAVCPGAIDTDLFRQSLGDGVSIEDVKSRYAMQRIGAASEVAAAVAFLLSEEASLITGSALAVEGGRVFH
jgi:NAD(P)-dependent dehydrogenase (short-subunit alcohol dehydrogenase family)